MTSSALTNIVSNEEIDLVKVGTAKKIINSLLDELPIHIENGAGPFLAAIYDENGSLIAKASNSVVNETCSNCHAEVNVIKKAEEVLGTYDLSKYNLSLYVTAEPCIMCIGAIMWSGIKSVYFSTPSKSVEEITGFDEGFKPEWLKEFKNRGITVYGNIEAEYGRKVLEDYVKSDNTIYKPQR